MVTYLRQLTTLGKVAVWLVDGESVRDSDDEDEQNFTDFALRCEDRNEFVPTNEAWISDGTDAGERPFFLDNIAAQLQARDAGHGDYEAMLAAGDAAEKNERAQVDGKFDDGKAPFAADGVGTQWGTIDAGGTVAVFKVDGRKIRDTFVDWTEGGNDLAQPAIVPDGTIFLDDADDDAEMRLTLLHEATERAEMAKGSDYPAAHNVALRAEHDARAAGDVGDKLSALTFKEQNK